MNKSQQPILSPAEQEILEQLTVRLIRPQERARFDELIIQEHYLHSAELGIYLGVQSHLKATPKPYQSHIHATSYHFTMALGKNQWQPLSLPSPHFMGRWACFEKTDTEVVWHIANWFGIQSQPGTDT